MVALLVLVVLTVGLVRLVVAVQFAAQEQLGVVVVLVVLLVPVWFVLARGLVLLLRLVSRQESGSVLGLTVRLVVAMVLVAVLQMDLVGLGGLLLVELVLWAELLQMDLVGLRGLLLVAVELL